MEHWMVPALFGKQCKAIKKLSQSMGGVVLRVSDGICRGRATSVEAARQATRKLEERVRGTAVVEGGKGRLEVLARRLVVLYWQDRGKRTC